MHYTAYLQGAGPAHCFSLLAYKKTRWPEADPDYWVPDDLEMTLRVYLSFPGYCRGRPHSQVVCSIAIDYRGQHTVFITHL